MYNRSNLIKYIQIRCPFPPQKKIEITSQLMPPVCHAQELRSRSANPRYHAMPCNAAAVTDTDHIREKTNDIEAMMRRTGGIMRFLQRNGA